MEVNSIGRKDEKGTTSLRYEIKGNYLSNKDIFSIAVL